MLLLSWGWVAATGCHKAATDATAGNLLAFNDYEAIMGWMSGTESITRERAHSGSRAVQVGGPIEYGLGYGLELSQTPSKWVKISQDITLPDSTNGAQQLRVFLWRASASSPAYLDDLRISEVP
nr:hypothetical protein [Tanacetum cinerariifolium]